jgi:hypothetical protein
MSTIWSWRRGESRLEADAYGLDGLEYGYEEEGGVERGHDKELPVWSSTNFASTLQSEGTIKDVPETT